MCLVSPPSSLTKKCVDLGLGWQCQWGHTDSQLKLFDKVHSSIASSKILLAIAPLPLLPTLCPSHSQITLSLSLSHTYSFTTNLPTMAGGKKLIARCHQHKWCNKKGCHYRPKLQPIPEDGEFKPRGLILVKLPSQGQRQATESRKRKHHTILGTFSEEYRYAKMNKLSDAWTQQAPWQARGNINHGVLMWANKIVP